MLYTGSSYEILNFPGLWIPYYFLPESQPVICEFDVIEPYGPQMQVCQCGVGEAFQVDCFRTAKVISCWLADSAGELCAADATDALRFQGDGAGDFRIAAELSTMPCVRIGGYYQRVVVLIPCKEARSAPGSLFAYGGDAQQVVPAEK